MKNRFSGAALVAATLSLIAAPARAHHAMGGEMPTTLTDGLVSGLAHPVIGVDHLAFIIAAGVIAAVAGLGRLAPIAFVAASIAGVALHIALLELPAVELVIALSVVLGGGLLAYSARSGQALLWLALFAVAGVFHGYAYGESIVGAETTPLVAYLVGLAIIQSVIAAIAYEVTASRNWLPQSVAPRLVGAAAFGVGISATVGQIFG